MCDEKTKYISFAKMHGAGNDYIYVDATRHPLEHPEEWAVRWSAPHTGIGSDGLVLIEPSQVADFRMCIFNADGSEAMMCGNASRCIGKYVYEHGLTDKKEIALETLSGIKIIRLTVEGKKVVKVTVNMGNPVVAESVLPVKAGGQELTGIVVSMGNPHLVLFTQAVDQLDVSGLGAELEYHPAFPNRTNVEFAQVLSDGSIRMRVWERGSGITQACGTGACATAVAAAVSGAAGRHTTVCMDGGTLGIAWDEQTGDVWMTGDAVEVFEGRISLES